MSRKSFCLAEERAIHPISFQSVKPGVSSGCESERDERVDALGGSATRGTERVYGLSGSAARGTEWVVNPAC